MGAGDAFKSAGQLDHGAHGLFFDFEFLGADHLAGLPWAAAGWAVAGVAGAAGGVSAAAGLGVACSRSWALIVLKSSSVLMFLASSRAWRFRMAMSNGWEVGLSSTTSIISCWAIRL